MRSIEARKETVLKRSLVVIVAVTAGAALWLENGHRVFIDAPFAADASSAAAAAGCAENDTMPYSEDCVAFLTVRTESAPRMQGPASVAAPEPCPDNDRVPYSPSCIAFLKGASETGTRWRATDQAPSIPAPQ